MGSDLQQSAVHQVAVHKRTGYVVHDWGLSEARPTVMFKSNCQLIRFNQVLDSITVSRNLTMPAESFVLYKATHKQFLDLHKIDTCCVFLGGRGDVGMLV